MWFRRFTSFNDVAERYNTTKPVISKQHPAEHDVRPIGKRRRKWERIIKLSQNTYVLSHGGPHDPVFNWHATSKMKEFPLTNEQIAKCAPIVWRRHRDGSETITVRNGMGSWGHQSRYSFLGRALPYGLMFQNGRQGIQHIRTTGGIYYLAKTRTVPKYMYEKYREDAAASPNSWAAHRVAEFCTQDDGLALTFRREKIGEGQWEIVGKAPAKEAVSVLVDIDAKKTLKPHIEKLYEWATTMYPMVRGSIRSYDFLRDVNSQVEQWVKENWHEQVYISFWNAPFRNAPVKLARTILKNENHPLRYALGVAAMCAMHGEDNHRSAYNKWVNMQFGLAKKVVKKEQ